VLGNDYDSNGDPLTAVRVSGPSNGTLALSADGSFSYTPATGFAGVDTFTYKVYDGSLYSAAVAVSITVSYPTLPDGAIRVAGPNRYATSVEASKRGFPDGARTIVIATGANWPDALGGSALAGAVDGPLLLTKPDALPSEVTTEIKRLGATKAYILGSTASVSADVEKQLKGLGLTVIRKGGSNRYETARMVADETIRLLGSSYEGHALVATGLNFPDASGAAPVAAALGRPILLANVTAGTVSLPPAVNKVVILGSTAAVPSKVETYLDTTLGSANVDRLAGANRYDTAARAAQLGVNAGMRWDGTGLATGLNFPDALSGGAMLGKLNSVMLLTRPDLLSGEARTKLYNNRAVIDTLFIFGDTNAVSSAVEVAAKAAATVK
jgi:putative cell wall-binding protein